MATKMNTFEHGSIKVTKGEVSVYLSSDDLELADLEPLRQIHQQDRLSLHVKSIDQEHHRFIITYEIPDHFLSMNEIKKETLPIRLSVLKTILDEDPLRKDRYLSIHPSTLFFRPMSAVRFTYNAIGDMPKGTEQPSFHQYKALVLSVLTNQSFEAFLKNGEEAYQPNKVHYAKAERQEIDKLVSTIRDSKTLEDLKRDIQDSLEYAQYQYFGEMKAVKRSYKTKVAGMAVASLLFLGVGVGVTQALNGNEHEEVIAGYESDLFDKNLEIQALTLTSEGRYDEAAAVMQKQGKDPTQIAELLIEGGHYQSALDVTPESLEEVITALYEQEEKEKVLDLSLEGNRKLAIEKAIVANDVNEMANEISFLEDSNTAMRMGEKFLEEGDTNKAVQIADNYELEDLHKHVALSEKESQLIALKDDLDKVSSDDELKKKDKKNQEKNIQSKIETTQTEIASLKEELGIEGEENEDA